MVSSTTSAESGTSDRIEVPTSPCFLYIRALPLRGAQHDMVLGAFEFQGIAGADLHGVAHGFGQDYAARFVDGQSGIHNGILPHRMPFLMPLNIPLLLNS